MPLTEQSNTYPTQAQHAIAWEKLAKDIAALEDQVSEDPQQVKTGNQKGKLTVIGSGIETVGFTIGDQELIQAADKVFFCVADPGTVVWLRQLRPDAYDLYVLYNDNKIRFITYMQMAESMLYYVRQGLHVVSIFYGHPGIFVLSTHRAILIARREGHQAIMKPSVCALDCLCADLGVDPCHPGMQTHEATDMLLRQRIPDTHLHVVLWQVGLIGEMGFRRKGYINHNFSAFINYLQKYYGKDYPLTHYIASKYPTIPPLIEVYPLEALHNPATQMKINGLSTFYIPPKESVAADATMAAGLGLIKPGEKLKKPSGPLREIGCYTARERKAFKNFAHFKVPKGYQWQPKTQASQFILALRQDMALQALYEKDPRAALNDSRFAELTHKEKALLLSRDAGALQIAAKGTYQRSTAHQAFLTDLLHNKPLAIELVQAAKNTPQPDKLQKIDQLLKSKKYDVAWSSIHKDIDNLNRNSLLPWTGVYQVNGQKTLITIIGHTQENKKSIVYINDLRIRYFSFSRGALQWKTAHANPHNGLIRFDVDKKGQRRLIGTIWPDQETIPANLNFEAVEVDPHRQELGKIASNHHQLSDITNLYGSYAVQVAGAKGSLLKEFQLSDQGLHINKEHIHLISFKNGKLTWQSTINNPLEGALTFLFNPITQHPQLFGKMLFQGQKTHTPCYGTAFSKQKQALPQQNKPASIHIPDWAWSYLYNICLQNTSKGGLLLWQKWAKYHFISRVINQLVYNLNQSIS